MKPKSAMIFAAGFGTRMQPLTDTMPKPMLQVAGVPLIDYTLELLDNQGIETVVVNTHYLSEQIEQHLEDRPNVSCSHEAPDVLETGGGLKNALPMLGSGPVLTLNSDVIFAQKNPLPELLRLWDPAKMDALLTLIPIQNTIEHNGVGDFYCAVSGQIERRGSRKTAPYVYAGVQILKTDRLTEIAEKAFSLNVLWNTMIAEGRAFGMVHSYPWVDVGTPKGLLSAEKVLKNV